MDILLKQYARLEAEYRQLENERAILRSQIVLKFNTEGIDKQNTDYGHFSIGHRLSYEFTESVKKLEDKVKIAKDKEIKKGVAKAKVTDYLIFKTPQNEHTV